MGLKTRDMDDERPDDMAAFDTSTAVRAIRVRRGYEQVADQLRHRIVVSGELQTGEQLPTEDAIAREFQTSRGTVREALRMLSVEGLVTTRPGAKGGTYVSRPDPLLIHRFLESTLSRLAGSEDRGFSELLQVREILEVSSASLAAANRNDQHLERLRKLIPDNPQHLEIAVSHRIHVAFHDVIMRAGGNELLRTLSAPTFSAFDLVVDRRLVPKDFANLVLKEHQSILDAIEKKDPVAAAAAMATHLKSVGRTYLEIQKMTPNGRVQNSDYVGERDRGLYI